MPIGRNPEISKDELANTALIFLKYKRGEVDTEHLISSIVHSYLPTDEMIQAYEEKSQIEPEDSAKVILKKATESLVQQLRDDSIDKEQKIFLFKKYIEVFVSHTSTFESTFIKSGPPIQNQQEDTRSGFQKILDEKMRK